MPLSGELVKLGLRAGLISVNVAKIREILFLGISRIDKKLAMEDLQ